MNVMPLTPRERLRRVVITCCRFARNVSFHEAGHTNQAKRLLQEHHPEVVFWRTTNANFIDVAVLEWCKLFGDRPEALKARTGKHSWQQIVRDKEAFKAGLLAHLNLDDHGFRELINEMRRYRDGFIAHLDDERVMHIPRLQNASAAVRYYHRHIFEHEARPGELANLPTPQEFALGFRQCAEQAEKVFALYRAEAIPKTS